MVIKVEMAETITLEVTRYRPEEETEPTSQSFEVPILALSAKQKEQ